MEICFCYVCTSRIPNDAFKAGAIRTDEGRHYCAACAPKAMAATATASAQAVGKAPTGSHAAPMRESGQNSSVTRFYFCETCNKRITDKQILDGLARDKKMKGIYCNECSVGVNTMEFEAITEPPPKNVRQSGGNVRQSGGHAGRTGTSPRSTTANLVPVKRLDTQTVKSGAHAGAPAKSQTMMFAAVVITVLSLAALAPKVLRSGSAPKHDGPKEATAVALVNENPIPVQPALPVLPAPPEVSPAPAKKEPDDQPNATTPPVESVAAPAIDKPAVDKPVAVTPAPELPAESKTKLTEPTPAQPAASSSAANADLIGRVLRLVGQRQISDAVALVRENKDAAEASRQELSAALDAMQKEDVEFQKALTALVGKRIKVQTAKESAEGTLKTLDYPLLRIEKSIAIDGQSMGSTLVAINVTDLNEASRAAIYRADAGGVSDTGRALLAMSSQRLDEAQTAIPQIKEPGVREVLAAELRRAQDADTETRAQAAWTAILAHAKDANSLTRAKQVQTELAAFEKNFGYSQLGQTSGVSTAMVEMKERMARIALGLDPRLQTLFKGRIAAYDAANCILTLEYDFSTKEQTTDFVGSIWAPPGDHTGISWAKGKLTTFCKMPLDPILLMPQFISSTVNLQVDYSNPRGIGDTAQVAFGFMGVDRNSSTNIRIICNRKSCTVFEDGKTPGTAPCAFMDPKQAAHLEIACHDKAIGVKFNGATVLDCNLSKSPKNTGIWFGGGWDSGVTITKMKISGQLDPVWLANALKSAK